jgi:hypothetical protein
MRGPFPANPKTDWQALYLQLGQLVASMPDLTAFGPIPPDTMKWLARADLLVSQVNNLDVPELRAASSVLHASPVREVQAGVIAMLVGLWPKQKRLFRFQCKGVS